MRSRGFHSHSAPLAALLALLAAILLPGLHSHNHSHNHSHPSPTNPSHHHIADSCSSSADHDHPTPTAPHDEHNCPICELILLAPALPRPDPAPSLNLIAPEQIAHLPLAAQRTCVIAHPRSLPARGPPVS